jgi:hypothetical protein
MSKLLATDIRSEHKELLARESIVHSAQTPETHTQVTPQTNLLVVLKERSDRGAFVFSERV